MTSRTEYLKKLAQQNQFSLHEDFYYLIEDEDGNTLIFDQTEVNEDSE